MQSAVNPILFHRQLLFSLNFHASHWMVLVIPRMLADIRWWEKRNPTTHIYFIQEICYGIWLCFYQIHVVFINEKKKKKYYQHRHICPFLFFNLCLKHTVNCLRLHQRKISTFSDIFWSKTIMKKKIESLSIKKTVQLFSQLLGVRREITKTSMLFVVVFHVFIMLINKIITVNVDKLFS